MHFLRSGAAPKAQGPQGQPTLNSPPKATSTCFMLKTIGPGGLQMPYLCLIATALLRACPRALGHKFVLNECKKCCKCFAVSGSVYLQNKLRSGHYDLHAADAETQT